MVDFFRRSFRNRLFAAMLISSLLPLLICTLLMVQVTRIGMDNMVLSEAEAQSQALLQGMDSLHEELMQAAQALSKDTLIMHTLRQGITGDLESNSRLFDATRSKRSYAEFSLFDNNGICCSTTLGEPEVPLPTNWGLLGSVNRNPDQPAYVADEASLGSNMVLLSAAVRLGDSGYLVMRIFPQGFRNLLDGRHAQSDVMILNRFFRPVYATQSYLGTTLAPQMRQQLLLGNELEEENYIFSVKSHEPTGLYLVMRHPRTATAATLRLMYTVSALFAVICVMVAVAVSLPLSHQISRPIQRLRFAMEQVRQDDLETQLDIESPDELGQLAHRFNRMVTDLKNNRQALLDNQQELNAAQIRMMQAQLNPHFLGNTLDTMKWISKINKVPQVALMATNLADILRFAISSQELVPLYREVEILERYIEIQKIRLSDDFTFTITVPEELWDCMVPKMILQPIVENAILHGLVGVEASAITVTAVQAGSQLRITVADNGKGFPEDMVGKPYRRDKSLAKGHLGLYNVDTILMRYFGGSSGLYIGNPQQGASVTAALPIQYEEEG